MGMLPRRLMDTLRRRSVSLPRPDESYRLSTYPDPYPAGYYQLLTSDELRRGELRYVEALGERLVVFRDAQGRPRVLDAHCPHQGANLAGGRLRDGCVECPFHAWRFEGSGDKGGCKRRHSYGNDRGISNNSKTARHRAPTR